MQRRHPAIATIDIIDSYLSTEETEALTIRRGKNNEIVITPRDQLIARYGHLYSLHEPSSIGTYVASIIDGNQINFQKLKQLEQLREELLKPESYYQSTQHEEEKKKNTGIISSSDSGAETLNIIHLKSRTGTSQYAREYDLESDWDQQNQILMNSLKNLSSRNENSLNWSFKETGIASEALPKVTQPETTNPVAQILTPAFGASFDPDQDQTVYLNTVDINSQQTANATRGNSFSKSGRSVKSDSKSGSKVQQYSRAKAITELQLKQEVNIRERIIAQFSVLFTELPCQ